MIRKLKKGMRVKRGKVLTPRRGHLIFAYIARHRWVHQWPGTGAGPAANRWGKAKLAEFEAWEDAFLVEETP